MESKREEFRKYLEKGGALQALNYALSRLYEMQEKPLDPLAYIAERLQQCLETGKLEEARDVTPAKPNGSVAVPTSLPAGPPGGVGLIEDVGYGASPKQNNSSNLSLNNNNSNNNNNNCHQASTHATSG